MTKAAVAIAALAFVGLFAFALPFPLIIGISALVGALVVPVRRATADNDKATVGPSLIDRLFSEGRLEHARPNLRRALGAA